MNISPSELRSTLYITYDGLLDPLGGSQILPYLEAISKNQRRVHVLSFEKPFRLKNGRKAMFDKLSSARISWYPLKFTRNLGMTGKIWDLLRLYLIGAWLAFSQRPKYVHARGHVAAQVGLFLKRYMGLKLIFDFRGLWVDERVDKGSWNLDKVLDRFQYRYYKRIERKLLKGADHIVVLTEVVVDEIVRLGAGSRNKVCVIPCCADFSLFKLADAISRRKARAELGVPDDSIVIGYLGSVGNMYLIDKFFHLIELTHIRNPNLNILAITPDIELFNEETHRHLPPRLHKLVIARYASREEVAQWLPAIDVLVSFIRASYARQAASPTKLAEAFAAGIPAICNYGIGDVTKLIIELDAGSMVDTESDADMTRIANNLPSIILKGGARLRQRAQQKLSLEMANDLYEKTYRRLDKEC